MMRKGGRKPFGSTPTKSGRMIPGKSGVSGGRVVGKRNPFQGPGRKKFGPASGKNAGSGLT